ncbi:heme A synthase [Solihabitans fulvus]|uniref:Heme A synthase n=1 Tax=Solihabitans fulvus TaxID=1892852 RepID=A0A5B2XET0_9PSEU|nr:heme A synthase [Solihabitans fulvus]KAA2261756.1 heme A synthase [Solihabitans fulvus]
MPAPSWISRIPSPSIALQRAFAVAAVIAQGGIAVTGSIVRVTGSGLGCPTWPQCVDGSLTPVEHPDVAGLHQWVEFTNRTLTGVVGVIAALCVLSAYFHRPRRRRVLVLALTMPIGVVVQAVIGGVVVHLGLVWWSVSVHFLVSMVLTWLAMLLYGAIGEGDEPARPLVPRALRSLELAMVGVLALLLMAGNLVTSAGPHAGDAKTPRLHLPVSNLAQLHADVLFVFLGMLVALGFALRAHDTPTALWRRYWAMIAVVLGQGALGMVQYLTGIPEVLVSIHVFGAGLVVVAMAALWQGSRDRGPAPTLPAEATVNTDDAKDATVAEQTTDTKSDATVAG